ncbi:MAG TPA: TrkA C-terminal domain-containing protein [Actinomycetota bacterium]|nr:TrkA C-terminal domain-containing protein [Actinomycetota bacterium]
MEQRRTLKDLLTDAKDESEFMVDLAYAAVFFGDEAIAQEVLQLEESMDEIVHELRTIAVLAGRSREDAEALAGVMRLAGAMEKIADAAQDIARVVLKDLGVPPGLRDDLRHAEEAVARIRLRDENDLEGKTLEELELPTHTGMQVIAIRRGVRFLFDVNGDTMIQAGDVLFVQGPEEGIDLMRQLAGAPPRHLREPVAKTLTGIDRAVDLIVEMKNSTEVAVGLAYSAILFRDKGLAAEVFAIEDKSDEMLHELERWVLRATVEVEDPDELRGLLHLAAASERIGDAAQDMMRLVEGEDEIHPIIAEALAEADEIVAEATVAAEAPATGRTLRDLKLRTETGLDVLGVSRGGRWIYRPRAEFTLLAGDRVLAVGPEDGAEALDELCGVVRDEED